jgi:hypothetical protein
MYGEEPEETEQFCLPEPTTYKFTVYFDSLQPDQSITHIKTYIQRAVSDEFETEVSIHEVCWSGNSSTVLLRVKSLQTYCSMSELEDVVADVIDGTVGSVGRASCVDTSP